MGNYKLKLLNQQSCLRQCHQTPGKTAVKKQVSNPSKESQLSGLWVMHLMSRHRQSQLPTLLDSEARESRELKRSHSHPIKCIWEIPHALTLQMLKQPLEDHPRTLSSKVPPSPE